MARLCMSVWQLLALMKPLVVSHELDLLSVRCEIQRVEAVRFCKLDVRSGAASRAPTFTSAETQSPEPSDAEFRWQYLLLLYQALVCLNTSPAHTNIGLVSRGHAPRQSLELALSRLETDTFLLCTTFLLVPDLGVGTG